MECMLGRGTVSGELALKRAYERRIRYLRHAASSSHSGFPQKVSSCVSHQSLPHLTKAQWGHPSIPESALVNEYCDSTRAGNCSVPQWAQEPAARTSSTWVSGAIFP